MLTSLVVYEKTDTFSSEEDAIIIARVQSGQCKKGFWKELAEELGGREPHAVREHWKIVAKREELKYEKGETAYIGGKETEKKKTSVSANKKRKIAHNSD